MDCKPYNTAKYYKAYRPVIPVLVSVCPRATVDTKKAVTIIIDYYKSLITPPCDILATRM